MLYMHETFFNINDTALLMSTSAINRHQKSNWRASVLPATSGKATSGIRNAIDRIPQVLAGPSPQLPNETTSFNPSNGSLRDRLRNTWPMTKRRTDWTEGDFKENVEVPVSDTASLSKRLRKNLQRSRSQSRPNQISAPIESSNRDKPLPPLSKAKTSNLPAIPELGGEGVSCGLTEHNNVLPVSSEVTWIGVFVGSRI